MKSKTTLICAVVLVLAIAYIVLKNTDVLKPSAPPPSSGQKTLLDMPKGEKALGEISHLEIAAPGGETIVLQREAADKWRLVRPLSAGADGLKAKDLADSIKRLEYVQSLEPGDADASDQLTSLNKPQWTLAVGDQAGVARKLFIGKNPPLTPGQTYVRVEGDKHVYIVAGDLAAMLNKSPADLRDKNVMIAREGEVQRVDIEGNEQYTLTRVKGAAGEDTWTISQPGSTAGMAADGPKVRDLLRRLDPLTAIDFVADAPATLEGYGLDKPRLTVSVWSGTGVSPVSSSATSAPAQSEETHGRDAHATTASAPALKRMALAIGTGTTEKVYAKLLDEPAVFQIEASLLSTLSPKIADLRDKQVLHFDVPQVKGIVIQGPQGVAKLDRKGMLAEDQLGVQWTMTEPLAGKANAAVVAATLDAAKRLTAQSFEAQGSPERFGLDKPQAKITLVLDKDAQVTLLVGKASASGEMTFVQPEHGVGVAVVKTADVKPLLEAPASYWDARIWTKPVAEKISQLALSRPDGQFELRDDGTQWSVTKPTAVPANKDIVNGLLDFLENATATKIVSLGSAVPAKYAEAKDLITVTVRTGPIATSGPATAPATQASTGPASQPTTATAQKVKTYVLKLAKVEGSAYVWLDGAAVAAVGELPASTYDDFAGNLRSLDIWTIEPADVSSIKITSAKTLEFVKVQQEWKYPADPFVKIDGAKVKGFLDGVKQVQAQKFMPLAPTSRPADYGLESPEVVIELGCKDGPRQLTISKKGPDASGRYASSSGVQGLFVVSGELVGKVAKGLDDFKK